MFDEIEDEEDKVECNNCEGLFDENDLNSKGLCDSCAELDSTPTSDECDFCDKVAVTNICGTNLCDDCEDNYHY